MLVRSRGVGQIPGQNISLIPAEKISWTPPDPGYPGGMIGPGESPLGPLPQPGDVRYTSIPVPTVPTDAEGNPISFLSQYGIWIVLGLGAIVLLGGRR